MAKVKFTEKNNNLYINNKKVVKGWESWNGWYWFAVEKDRTQDSVMENNEVRQNDTIWFGYVQGLFDEWGYFSEAELTALIKKDRVWEIPKQNLHYSGRRN